MSKLCASVLVSIVVLLTAQNTVPKHWGEPKFKGKRVLVTGGDSGIGFAAVQAFYLECAKVLLVGHSEPKSKAAADEIQKLHVPSYCSGSSPAVAWAAADIRNATEVFAFVTFMISKFGGFDIAVNNAGIMEKSPLKQIGDPDFLSASNGFHDESVMAVNVDGALKCMNAEIGHWLNTSTQGVMINVASIAGELAWFGPLYTTSKWAMIGFSKQAALQYAKKGIRVNVLAPGFVNTTLLRDGRSSTDPTWIAQQKYMESMVPMGRIAEPWEMAGAITFLASDMSSYMTGDVLTADGDLSQGPPGQHFGSANGLGATTVTRAHEHPIATISAASEGPKHWGEPKFKGKRVLVTGGDSGIGFAAVQAFYLECAKVFLVGHNEVKSKAAYREILALAVPSHCSGTKPEVAWAAADVRNETEVIDVLHRVVSTYGGLDIAVNSAGIVGSAGRFAEIGDPDFISPSGGLYDDSAMAVNVDGTLKCMNAEISHWLNTSTQGVIINVASIAGEVAWLPPLYTTSKWAMIGFSKQAALQYAKRGIRVNVLAPGFVNTSMLRHGLSPNDPRWIESRKNMEAMVPLGRIAEPWEMAGPITFMASDMANYITGAVATADGDLSQQVPGVSRHEASEFRTERPSPGSLSKKEIVV